MDGLDRLRDEATALPRWVTIVAALVLLVGAGVLGWRAVSSGSQAVAGETADGVASPPAPR